MAPLVGCGRVDGEVSGQQFRLWRLRRKRRGWGRRQRARGPAVREKRAGPRERGLWEVTARQGTDGTDPEVRHLASSPRCAANQLGGLGKVMPCLSFFTRIVQKQAAALVFPFSHQTVSSKVMDQGIIQSASQPTNQAARSLQVEGKHCVHFAKELKDKCEHFKLIF